MMNIAIRDFFICGFLAVYLTTTVAIMPVAMW